MGSETNLQEELAASGLDLDGLVLSVHASAIEATTGKAPFLLLPENVRPVERRMWEAVVRHLWDAFRKAVAPIPASRYRRFTAFMCLECDRPLTQEEQNNDMLCEHCAKVAYGPPGDCDHYSGAGGDGRCKDCGYRIPGEVSAEDDEDPPAPGSPE